VLVFVKPETVSQWHRAGFPQVLGPGSRGVSAQVGLDQLWSTRIDPALAAENPTWGAPRIHGELLMLGLSISERTVSSMSSPAATPRCARALDAVSPQPPRRDRGDGLLHCSDRNLPNPLMSGSRSITPRGAFSIFDVTDRPAAAWVLSSSCAKAFPHDSAMRHLIFDRDAIFSDRVPQR